MLALLSKYLCPRSNHFAPRPSWSCQWLGGTGLGGVGVASGFEAERQELSRRSHPQRGEDGTKSVKPAKDFGPSIGEQARLPGGGGGGYQKNRGKEADLCFRKTQ